MCGCVANSIIGQSDILFHVVLGVESYTFSQNQLENERCIKDIVVLSFSGGGSSRYEGGRLG